MQDLPTSAAFRDRVAVSVAAARRRALPWPVEAREKRQCVLQLVRTMAGALPQAAAFSGSGEVWLAGVIVMCPNH